MHRHWLDHSNPPAAGPLHKVAASIKVGVAVAMVLVLVAVPRCWVVYGIVAAIVVGLALVARVPAKTLLRRLMLAEPFVIGVAVLTLFQPHGGQAFLAVLVRSSLCVAVLVLLGAVTPFSEIVDVMRRARVPRLMVTTMTLMHRYLHVLVDESRRMRVARESRTFTGKRTGWTALSGVISQLFVRASMRSERIYAAMCSRGWE